MTIPADIKSTLLSALAYYMGDETSRLVHGRDILEKRCITAIEWVALLALTPEQRCER